MSGKQTHASVGQLMDSFLTKVAEEEKASANLDLAGDAKSKHPSAQADDGTGPATEGARSAENEADVNKTTPNTINSADTNNPAGGSSHASDSQGTQSMASDESAAGNVDTPKNQHSMASHPATGPGMEGKNDKAAGDEFAQLSKLGNDLLAQIAVLTKKSGEDDVAAASGGAAAAEAAPVADETGKEADEKTVALFKEAAEKYPEDVEAGYVAAALLAQQLGLLPQEKQASDDELTGFIANIRKQAAVDAENYVEFLKGYQESVEKGAMPEGAMPEGAMLDPSVLAALGNAEEGGDALAGAGEGGEEAAGEEAEEPSDEEAIEAIAEALDEAGVTPEQLAQAVAEAEGVAGEAEGAEEGMPAGMEAAASGHAPATKRASANASGLKSVLATYFNQ